MDAVGLKATAAALAENGCVTPAVIEHFASEVLRHFASPPSPREEDVEGVAASIRAAWCEWARTQPNPKPSWLVPWESLDEQSRDADRHLARWHLAALQASASRREGAWSKEAPTVPGWYWMRERGGEPEAVKVGLYSGRMALFVHGPNEGVSCEAMRAEWSPLSAPLAESGR